MTQGKSATSTRSTLRFLHDLDLRTLDPLEGWPFGPPSLALGLGDSALEVLVTEIAEKPPTPVMQKAWKKRWDKRPSPVLLVALYGAPSPKAAVCGPTEKHPPVVDIDPHQLERLCRQALEEPDRHAALRALAQSLPALETPLAAVRNEGLLADHELQAGAPHRKDWSDATERGRRVLAAAPGNVLSTLGFQVESHDRVTSILRSKDRKVAIAILLHRGESAEMRADRFGDVSPIYYALSVADRENLNYVVLQQGGRVRVYPRLLGVGVGRRGPSETYVEINLPLLRDNEAAYPWLLCSAEALAPGGSLEQLIEDSTRFAGELAQELRDRVYELVVPRLAQGIVAARRLRKPTTADLADTYAMTLTVLFRLLFIAYAEDKDLLPYRGNGLYKDRSLKKKAQELLQLTRDGVEFDEGTSWWDEVVQLFHAVDHGKGEWGVPAYDGVLFSEDPDVSRVGALLAPIHLPNPVFGPALRDLLLVQTKDGPGPVDFRSLGVREFGTIYEGLLENELSVAESDLAVDRKGSYRPAKGKDPIIVPRGMVYLHDASGARKSSGTYFTKQFAVEHLLDRALEPALKDHLDRLTGCGKTTA